MEVLERRVERMRHTARKTELDMLIRASRFTVKGATARFQITFGEPLKEVSCGRYISIAKRSALRSISVRFFAQSEAAPRPVSVLNPNPKPCILIPS